MEQVTVDKSYFDALLRRYVQPQTPSPDRGIMHLAADTDCNQQCRFCMDIPLPQLLLCGVAQPANRYTMKHTSAQLLGRADPASVTISRAEYDSLVCVKRPERLVFLLLTWTFSFEVRGNTKPSRMLSSMADSLLTRSLN